ncbi:MAG: hypothetical protein Q8P15_01895 [Nanoarchaeota archaeon]|nr:hypothetical protein [Nanoarchaeota archaeon]
MRKLLLILIIGIFLLNSVNAFQNGNSVFTGNFVSDFFTGSNGLDVSIAKYVLWAVSTILLFLVLKAVKIPENSFFRGIISLIIGFLIIAYLTPQEILTFLATFFYFSTRDLIVLGIIFICVMIVGIYLYKKYKKQKAEGNL